MGENTRAADLVDLIEILDRHSGTLEVAEHPSRGRYYKLRLPHLAGPAIYSDTIKDLLVIAKRLIGEEVAP